MVERIYGSALFQQCTPYRVCTTDNKKAIMMN